jgi:hypothetical protein
MVDGGGDHATLPVGRGQSRERSPSVQCSAALLASPRCGGRLDLDTARETCTGASVLMTMGAPVQATITQADQAIGRARSIISETRTAYLGAPTGLAGGSQKHLLPEHAWEHNLP